MCLIRYVISNFDRYLFNNEVHVSFKYFIGILSTINFTFVQHNITDSVEEICTDLDLKYILYCNIIIILITINLFISFP